ncbi:MAG: hypothetical protein M1837_005398 [Sclerophora amabilis]|nr:MAG: hypothetical protein M1837_005398 [Sclerophora amabilis]
MAGEDSHDSKGAVPKFASFRPKPKALPLETLVAGHDEPVRHREPKVQKDAVRHHEDHRHHHRRKKEHSRESHRSPGQHGEPSQDVNWKTSSRSDLLNPQIATWEADSDNFLVDKIGDPHILTYGTIHRYNIPLYYRSGGGRVVGLPKTSKIDRDLSGEQSVIIHDRSSRKAGRREKYVFARNERKAIRKLRIRPAHQIECILEPDHDYVALNTSRGVKRRKLSGSSYTEDGEESQHFRSIEGKAKYETRPSDEDLKYGSESSASDYEGVTLDSIDESARRHNIELSRVVENEPTNIDAWMALIRQQDVLFGANGGQKERRLTSAERSSLADIKLSMYEKAIGKTANSKSNRQSLIIGMMEEGSKLWEPKKQSAKWQSVIQDYPCLALWNKYFDFHQSNFMAFRCEEIRHLFTQSLETLRSSRDASQDPSDQEELEHSIVYLLLRFTLFLREAGFNENSVAIWQGLLELNFFPPKHFEAHGQSDIDLLASLEDFWESEVPRVGDIGANGWAHNASLDNSGPPAEPRLNSSDTRIDDQNIFSSWATAEDLLTLETELPARTIDETGEDDPYQVVLFSDIKDFMIALKSDQSKSILLDAFLTFCRLPELSMSSLPRSWSTDPFVRTEILEQSDEHLRFLFTSKANDNVEQRGLPFLHAKEAGSPHTMRQGRDVFECQFRHFALSTDSLFATNEQWCPSFDHWAHVYRKDKAVMRASWVRRVLQTFADFDIGGSKFMEYHLALEWTISPHSAKKRAKTLLKRHPSRLRIYNAYALMERRSGSIDAADKVLSTAISMSKTFKEVDQHDTILLWRTWIWELLQAGDTRAAWRIVLSIPEGRPLDDIPTDAGKDNDTAFLAHPAAILRTKRSLEAGLDSSLCNPQLLHHVVSYADILALFNYLSASNSIFSALPVYNQTLTQLYVRSSAQPRLTEILHQHRARLLYHHATTSRSFRPALIRDTLANSITAFPNNTIFLSLYAWNEARFRIDDRVRAVMQNVVLKERHETVIGWTFAIWHELNGRPRGAGYNTNSVKAVLERAVGSDSGKSSASLWKLYVLFSLHHLPASHTKDVFYRAIRSCPWAKQLVMLAFTHLNDIMSEDEMRAVWNVLVEKELRIHVDLEEVWERLDDERRVQMVEDHST